MARLIAPVVTTATILRSSNNVQNVCLDILRLANPDAHGKWPLTWKEIAPEYAWHKRSEGEIPFTVTYLLPVV